MRPPVPSPRYAFSVAGLAFVLAACQTAPQPPTPSASAARASSIASVASAPLIEPPPSDAGALPAEPHDPPRLPGPPLSPGQILAWQVEQDGRVLPAVRHTIELSRAPFTIAVHLRRGASDRVLVNAWLTPKTLDGASLGWPFKALEGMAGATRYDDMDSSAAWKNNARRDLYVSEMTPSAWFPCERGPGAAPCNGFDGPCEPTEAGLICRRTIASLEIYQGGSSPGTERRDVRAGREKALYLVLVVPGRWTEDQVAGKAPMGPESARAWGTLRWGKAE